jgi:sugar lactone lactonase YvrE
VFLGLILGDCLMRKIYWCFFGFLTLGTFSVFPIACGNNSFPSSTFPGSPNYAGTPTFTPIFTNTMTPTNTICTDGFGHTCTPTFTSTSTFTLTATYSPTLTSTPSVPWVTTLAGQAGVTGATNATGISASFNFPLGIAVDGSGNVYVADLKNCLIRIITSGGVVSTLAGQAGVTGATNATGTAASFNGPGGVAVDSSGNVYVGDEDNQLIREITSGGVVSTLAGQAGVTGATNATGTAASFNGPCGVAVDNLGNVYVADYYNRLIREITSGTVVMTLAGQAGVMGTTNATGTAASFSYPQGVAVDTSGNVYVADGLDDLIRKITSGGIVSTLAGQAGVTGATNATGTAATFYDPVGVAVDSSGNVYVAEYGNNDIRKITSGGVVTTLAGQAGVTGATNATGTAASFNGPGGVAVDNLGNIYVADSGNNLIRLIHPN